MERRRPRGVEARGVAGAAAVAVALGSALSMRCTGLDELRVRRRGGLASVMTAKCEYGGGLCTSMEQPRGE